MNCFRNLIAGVCAVIAATASATAAADEIEKFVATPVRVNDRFDKDTLKQYLTQGDVRWSMLKVSIPTGGMLAFQQLIEARFTLKLDVWPIEFDAQQQCVSQCRFMCGNGWEIVVVLQRVRQVGGIARQVAIAEIQRSGQESEPTVEQLAVSPVFGVPGDVENWTLGYNNGLVEVRCNGQLVVQGCGEAFSSWCNAVAFVQVSGKTELTQFSLQGRKAGYSPDQRRLYEETQRLRAQAEQALAEGDVKRAIQTEQQRFPLYERAFGKDELPAALSHQWIAEVADQLQRYAPAKRYFQQSADVFAKNLGDHHPQTLRARGWVGYEDAMLGNLDEGEAVLRPATEEYARICGLQDRGTRQLASLLQNVIQMQAGHSLQAQDYEKYQRSCEQVVALTTIICGSHSVEARDVQVQLEVARQIVAATPERQQQICAILKDIIRSNDLLHQNDIPASNKLARETLRRCRKVLGPKHPTTAGNMEFVGTGYVNERDFDHGIPLLKEAVAIRQELAGEQDVTVGRAQGLLATAYSRAGRNAEATKTFIAALAALEDNDAHVSIAVANTMADYGGHLLRSGQPKAAQEQLVKCLAEFQRCGAATDPNSLLAYQKLAEAYRAVGDNSNADKILGVFELLATQGNVGSTTAGISLQTTRAKHLYLQKKYQESVIEYHKATTEIGRIFGQRSSNYEQALEDLLEVYLAMRNTAGVERVLRELLDFARLRREAAYYASTPREQFENTASDRIWVNRLMALATNGMISPVVAYEHLLSIKGAVTLNQRRMQLAASRPELRPLLKQRQHTSAQISALLGQAMTEANSAKLDQLARTRDEIDVQMATKSDQYRQIAERPTVARLCEQLPADAAIVDYVEFDRPADWLARIFAVEHELSLAAFVTTKSGEVRLIELGAAGFIARSLGHWAEAIGAEVQNLGPTFDAKLEQATDSAGADLRQRVWDPLPADVRNSKLVIISPDGLLALCSFAALPLPDGRYLTENSAICYLPAVGLLPELLSRKTRADRESLLLVDDVDYDVADGLAANSATVNRLRFSALPNEAGLETDPVRAYFERRFPARKMVQLTRNRATEAKFRQQLAGASIVHLSTHGFCLPLSQLLVVPEQPDQPPVLEFDPLVAGVALAGANHSTYEDGLSDGILWASEISTLDLSGVDLVTLSACQTAMGNLVAGEGLQGTQRALIVAGAHSSLASLWNADDKATRVVMEQFYRSAWVDNNTKAQSLRQAMNYMLRKYPWRDGLAQEAKWHRCPPWLWSSWMLYGDWH